MITDTVMEGERKGASNGKAFSSKARFEHRGPDQFTLSFTDIVSDGEQKPDIEIVFSRVKPTTREDFEEFCRLQEGRWVSENTLDTDTPGIGKQGDKITVYSDSIITEDGNAIAAKVYDGKKTVRLTVYYDAGAKQIKALWVFSDGATGSTTIYKKSGKKWILNATGSLANGKRIDVTVTDVYSDNGRTLTSQLSMVIDGNKTDFPKSVSHRIGY